MKGFKCCMTLVWTLLALWALAAIVSEARADYRDDVRTLTNQARAAVGLPALRENLFLDLSAEAYAIQLDHNIPFSHTGPDGSTPFTRMQAAGYTGGTMGENIARGFVTPQDVMTAWLNSPGHRANILYNGYQHLGVGVAGLSWVQDFGAGGVEAPPSGTPPPPLPQPQPQPIPLPAPIVPAPQPVPVPVIPPPTRYVPPALPGYWNGLFYRYYYRPR